MLSWTDKWMLRLVVVWACADIVAISVSPRRTGLWVVVVMLAVGTMCKMVLAGLFILPCLQERNRNRIKHRINDPSIFSSLLTFPGITLKEMSTSAENIMRSLPPGDCTKLLMNLVRESGMILVDGLLVSSQLTSINLLGEGASGRVYELKLADVKTPVCIKVKKDRLTDYCFMWEVDNLQRLAGLEGVPRVLAVSVVPEAFIMTRHGRRTLEAWIKIWEMAKPKEKDVADVLHQLCNIMINLHALQVCHNDLKGDNVMVEVDETKKKKKGNRFRVTLVDFTILCNYGSCLYGDIPRTMFLPHNDPDLMRAERRCSEATDVFSMGYLLQRTLPFFTSQRHGTLEECSRRAMGPCHLRPSFLEIEKVLHHATK